MKTITLTVNGQQYQTQVEARTQLAAVLRDQLQLTGTHLACEQGVCGACTVLVDGKPIRSCIGYAHAFDGATIETVEGYQNDLVMAALKAAFSRHHALQCGFCTPGMLAAAHDIVLRLDAPDEARIRHELSGNICRCTGYVGIVAAIADVIGQGLAPHTERAAPAQSSLPPLTPFALSAECLSPAAGSFQPAASGVTIENGWTTVRKTMRLRHPADAVWALFSDIEKVAQCLPGATATAQGEDGFAGAITIAFGPIKASFAGEGTRRLDAAAREGLIDAQGKDASGQSNVRGQLAYRLTADTPVTLVALTMKYQVKGLLAQFNRPDLVESFVDIMLARFAEGCEASLSGRSGSMRQLNAFSLALAVVKLRLSRIFSARNTRGEGSGS